jgi:hypothetical protein
MIGKRSATESIAAWSTWRVVDSRAASSSAAVACAASLPVSPVTCTFSTATRPMSRSQTM